MNHPGRRVFTSALGAGIGQVLGLGWPGLAIATDAISPPPAFETLSSPSGRYAVELVLRPAARGGAQAHAARCTASLWQVGPARQMAPSGAASRQRLWARELAHRPRPRFALVGDGGQLLLLDEWLAVRSELAVMLIGPHGSTVAVHGVEAVRAALDVPMGALAPQARHGVWMQAPPTFSAAGNAVEVAAAGRRLHISLQDGRLSRR